MKTIKPNTDKELEEVINRELEALIKSCFPTVDNTFVKRNTKYNNMQKCYENIIMFLIKRGYEAPIDPQFEQWDEKIIIDTLRELKRREHE